MRSTSLLQDGMMNDDAKVERFLGTQAVSEVTDSPNSNPTCVTSSSVWTHMDTFSPWEMIQRSAV
jgi:hypothetical protein